MSVVVVGEVVIIVGAMATMAHTMLEVVVVVMLVVVAMVVMGEFVTIVAGQW